MRGKWILISVTVVALAVAAGALSVLRKDSSHAAAPAHTAAPPAPPTSEVSLPGKIEAQHVVAVPVQISGSVGEFMVDVGEDVYEGEVIARISNGGLETARESASSAVEMAQLRLNKIEAGIIAARLEASRARADAVRARDELQRTDKAYQRQQMLHREGATPRLNYEKSQREYETAQAEFQNLDELARNSENRVDDLLKEQQNAKKILDDKSKELESTNVRLQAAEIHSPVDGLVVGRKGEVGRELGPQEQNELFRIAVDLGNLQMTVDPEPPVLGRIKPGQPALIMTADLQGEGISGTVKEIRGNQAVIVFTSPDPVLKPGMTAQARIKLQ
jgi:multidrug resistance efflux pump